MARDSKSRLERGCRMRGNVFDLVMGHSPGMGHFVNSDL